MPECRKFQQFGLACLLMAVISGILGFVIVYHYTQFQRPIQQFAIVIDAGSTQTRSSLFSLGIDTSSLIEWSNDIDEHQNLSASPVLPLTKLFQVRQVDTCVNGGPIANIKSQSNAKELASKCIKKFSKLIKKLDFESESDNQNNGLQNDNEENETVLDSEEVGEQMALLNHRVNSVTHLYLGATAGMRAIQQLNETRADEKIHWIDRAINESQGLIENGPYINKAYLGILKGSDEAAFGWISVNFVCDTLEAHHRGLLKPSIDSNSPSLNHQNHSSVIYSLPTEERVETNHLLEINNASLIESVGTLELGGASIQLAYQLPGQNYSESLIGGASLQRQNLDLFNNRYNLATRSDLCLGMSQAILRAYYILLWQKFRQSATSYPVSANESILNDTSVEIENPCLQKAAQISFTKEQLKDILKSPCLSISNQHKNNNQGEVAKFNYFIDSRKVFRFSGLGKAIECDAILLDLIEPNLCKNYFFICPDNKIEKPPPIDMPFVTISGYNKALQVLNLPRKALSNSTKTSELEQVIANKLGGYSIDHDEFSNQAKTFCALDVAEFPKRFPKMNKLYYGVNCLQLIYINKLLIEFYRFEPKTSWNQIKFLLYPVKSNKKLEGGTIESKHQDKNDIGWTLGLLLNATSNRFSSFGTANGQVDENEIYFHHGATTLFLIRTTIFFMFACCLLAICCIFIGAIVAHHQKQTRSGAYTIHNSYGGTSSPQSA